MLDTTHLTGKQRSLIQALKNQTYISSLQQFCQTHHFDFNFVKGFLLSGLLQDGVELDLRESAQWVLTTKGENLQGEILGYALVERLLKGQSDLAKLQAELGETFSLQYGSLRKEKVVDMGLAADTAQATEPSKTIVILAPEKLALFQHRQEVFTAIAQNRPITLDPATVDWLEQESLIEKTITQDYRVTVTDRLRSLSIKPVVTTLTSELLLSGQWESVDLKPYNIHDEVPDIAYGRPAILTQCIQRIRNIFLNMGFDEMSGCLVESAFWSFDVLFTPQDHPAREVQDTFYLTLPDHIDLPKEPDLVEAVQTVHEQSYGNAWQRSEAERALLRTHTTPFTAKKLYELKGQDGKFFSIDKVFRNENVDRTHLAEFYQIEGVVIGELLSVRSLMGYLTYFYQELGFSDLRFKPTYNPYTEPSLEVYAFHPPSQKYLEVGNSGLFRPEMLAPLGYEGKSTVAWGLGLERIAMLLYETEKLGDLVGADIKIQGLVD